MIALLSWCSVLAAAPTSATTPLEVDREGMTLLSDGKAHFVAVRFEDASDEFIYYGDGHTFFAVKRGSAIRNGDDRLISFFDPRMRSAELQRKGSGTTVLCNDRATALQVVADGDKTLAQATFLRSPLLWKAHALARDDQGVYYYVDRGRHPFNEARYRVFVGPKGGVKQRDLLNIVSDSGGDIFSTANGELRLVMSKNQATWIAKAARTPLSIVPIEANMLLIFNELGVYARQRFGTPCDDL